MAKGPHRPYTKSVLQDGTWVNVYEDGEIKIARYDSVVSVFEVLNRADGAHVRLRFALEPGKTTVKQPQRWDHRVPAPGRKE